MCICATRCSQSSQSLSLPCLPSPYNEISHCLLELSVGCCGERIPCVLGEKSTPPVVSLGLSRGLASLAYAPPPLGADERFAEDEGRDGVLAREANREANRETAPQLDDSRPIGNLRGCAGCAEIRLWTGLSPAAAGAAIPT